MSIRVIQAPSPIVTPADLQNGSTNDAVATAVIAAVTGEFDGPFGSLGRAFGPQVIEYDLPVNHAWRTYLPCAPVIGIVSIKYTPDGGDEVTIDPSLYYLEGDALFFRRVDGACYPTKVRYNAGFDGDRTGAIPPQIKQAIIIKSQFIMAAAIDQLMVKADEVEGVGRTEFTLPEQATALVAGIVNGLVAGLKVKRI